MGLIITRTAWQQDNHCEKSLGIRSFRELCGRFSLSTVFLLCSGLKMGPKTSQDVLKKKPHPQTTYNKKGSRPSDLTSNGIDRMLQPPSVCPRKEEEDTDEEAEYKDCFKDAEVIVSAGGTPGASTAPPSRPSLPSALLSQPGGAKGHSVSRVASMKTDGSVNTPHQLMGIGEGQLILSLCMLKQRRLLSVSTSLQNNVLLQQLEYFITVLIQKLSWLSVETDCQMRVLQRQKFGVGAER